MKTYTPTPNYGPMSYKLDIDVKITAKDCLSAVMHLLVITPAAFFFTTITKPIVLIQRFAFDQNKKAVSVIMPGRLQEHI